MVVLLIIPLLRMLAFSLICLATFVAQTSLAAHGAIAPHITNSDHLALMSFKSLVTSDPLRALSSWGNMSIPMCRWRGVACGLRGRRRGHVVALDLPELNLTGTISPALGNLTHLRRLNLSSNGFQGILPPELEYGLGNEVSTHGDVYSYGILLLEVFTGKRPTDNEFGEAMGLRKYVQMALPDRVSAIMDQHLLMEIEDGEPATSNSKLRISCITSILQVGISCSEELPTDRVSIGDALKELQAIRDKFQKLLREEASSSH